MASTAWGTGTGLILALTLMLGAPAQALDPAALHAAWPAPAAVAGIDGALVEFPSRSPFTIADIGAGAGREPTTRALGWLFLPDGASAARPVPAAVLLHGASGVSSARELSYGRQLAAMGIAALVVDAFAARRDRAQGFVQRLLEITETMLMADAYAALHYLDRRPEVDGRRVVLIGFSYGGMAATYATYAQVAERLAPEGLRFAGHVAFYAPCIARFARRETTGAPVLMLMGDRDQIIDPKRCAEIAADLEAGGSDVLMIVYEGAYHQWDGRAGAPWRAGRGLAGCRFTVEADGAVRDSWTRLAMRGPWTRRIILGLCSDSDGYVIARDDAVRARSNQALGAFLARVFAARGRPLQG